MATKKKRSGQKTSGKRAPKEKAATTKSGRRKKPVARAEPATAIGSETAEAEHATQAGAGFAIVGIGASAGGLDAFKQFFTAMPADADMAFVLIQHLDPTHESLTAELLAKSTRMSVVQVEDEMHVERNHVYVIPPNRYLSISGETLHLTEPVEQRGVRVPIDFFFRSLADDHKQRAIAVILSGTGSDGALGIREVKAGGGMVMAQTPETAQYDGMPRSAIATGVVDYVVPVEMMAETLVRYVRHWYVKGTIAPHVEEQTRDPLGTIVGLLRARLKYDFSCYKKGTLTRRLQRRMGLRHVADMGEYVEMLRQDMDEVRALYKDLLIGVTNFFREPDAWQELEKRVIEPLVARVRATMASSGQKASDPADNVLDNSDTIRVWTPGCATGEEPYSIAMLLAEKLQKTDKGCDINIFASDIDQDALAFARAGSYRETIATDVSAERLRRFFIKGEHTWRINKDIRESVVFAEQNVISDPPFSKLDLISCRNLLIYLQPEIQQKVIAMFHYALREGGFLFLGNAESISQQHDRFETISRKHRIYRRIGPVRHYRPEFVARAADQSPRPTAMFDTAGDRRTRHLTALAQQAVMQRFAPACVMVNHKAEVLYLSGPVDEYLQLPTGEPSQDLIAMARPGLRTKLRSALRQAIHDKHPVTLEEMRVKRGQKYFPVRVTIETLRQMDEDEGLLLIAFDESSDEPQVRVVYVEPPDPTPSDHPETAGEYEAVIRHLDNELANTREELQSTVEELETSNEEFKAANEEVLSINEELQSTNEELETSKEELQSLNEELQTVNSQLEAKVGELELTTNDLTNLLTSTDIATIFLDLRFRLRRFTPAATRLFRIRETDLGRPITDLAMDFIDGDLLADAQRVLERLTPIDKEVHTLTESSKVEDEGQAASSSPHWYVRRILPYCTEDNHIAGVVITFADITVRKEHQHAQERLNQELDRRVAERTAELRRMSRVFHDAADPIIIEDLDGRVVEINEETVRAYGWSREELLGQSSKTIVPPEQHQQIDELLLRCREGGAARNVESLRQAKDGRTRPVLMTFTLLTDDEGEPSGVATLAKDISELREIQKSLAQLADHERQRLGRELHDSLGQQISGIALLAATLHEHAPTGSQDEVVSKLKNITDEAKRQLRSFIKGLVPVDVDAEGLRVALAELANETTETHGLPCRFKCRDEVSVDDNFVATELLLIAREAVHNGVKHAGANEIVIQLQDDGGIRLSVRDDGCGIPVDVEPRATMGLRIMRHRCGLIGGTFTIETPPVGGTAVTCSVGNT